MSKRYWRISALAIALILLCGAQPAAAEGTYAVVTGTATLNVRSIPDASGAWLGRVTEGSWVEEIAPVGNGWYYCRVPGQNLEGYMAGAYLTEAGSNPGGGDNTGVVVNPIASQYLNLREYPSYSARVLGRFYNGQTCRVLNTQSGWYYVYVNGLYGYFKSEYVYVSGTAGSSTAYVSTGNSGRLNLRSAPDLSGDIIGRYPNGTLVTVHLKGKTWWQVTVNGVEGFMESAYLTESAPYDPTPVTAAPFYPVYPTAVPSTGGYCVVSNPNAKSVLNLRAQPSTSAKVLAQYHNGIRFEVLEQGLTWCKVYGKSSGRVGYVMTKYVKLYQLPGVPLKTVSNGSSYVNLRTKPNKTSGSVKMQVPSGAVVTVLIPGDTWTKVRYGSLEGYMMTVFLK